MAASLSVMAILESNILRRWSVWCDVHVGTSTNQGNARNVPERNADKMELHEANCIFVEENAIYALTARLFVCAILSSLSHRTDTLAVDCTILRDQANHVLAPTHDHECDAYLLCPYQSPRACKIVVLSSSFQPPFLRLFLPSPFWVRAQVSTLSSFPKRTEWTIACDREHFELAFFQLPMWTIQSRAETRMNITICNE